MNTDIVTDAELDLVAIKHRQLTLFCVNDRIALARLAMRRVRMKDRLPVGRLHDQLWLEEPRRVAQLLRLVLPVDQKQRHRPEMVAAADDALHFNFVKFAVGNPSDLAGLQRDWFRNAFALAALPDQPPGAGFGC